MSETVVAGVDGSSNAGVALDAAVEEAQSRGAALKLVSAYTAPVVRRRSVSAEYQKVQRQEAADVAEAAAAHARHAGVEVTTEVRAGDPSTVLLEESRTAALLVVGARGRGGVLGTLLGSVAASLPAHAACPVLVVPQHTERADDGAEEFLGRIVVGVDGTGAAGPALPAAADLARRRGRPLAIVAVAGAGFTRSRADRADSGESAARAVLTACLDSVHATHPELDAAAHLRDGTAATVLADISDAAEMMVVGARGSGGVTGMRLGSTTHDLLGHAHCPVLVAR